MVITVYSSEQCKIIYTNFQKLKDPMCWPIFTFPFAALYGLDCLILSFVVCLNGQINMMFSGLIFSYFVILTSSFRHRSLSVYQLRFITLDGVCAARVSAILHYMLNLNTLHLFTILVAAHTHTHTHTHTHQTSRHVRLVACPQKKSVLLFQLLTAACSCGRLLLHCLTARFLFFPLSPFYTQQRPQYSPLSQQRPSRTPVSAPPKDVSRPVSTWRRLQVLCLFS